LTAAAEFSLTFEAGSIAIDLHQGEQLLEQIRISDNTYKGGKFGFYNYSQAKVKYEGFEIVPMECI
jgi:hypothetical protein